jgi:hypothetical protein
MQDMIHRAVMGNFTSPSMRPGGLIRCCPFLCLFLFSSLATLPSFVSGLFHVEECGDDINNCEEQVHAASPEHIALSSAPPPHLISQPLAQRGPRGKDFMDDYDWANKQPHPLRARGAASQPKSSKAGTRLLIPHVVQTSLSCAVAAPLVSRARHLPRAQTQQMASTEGDAEEHE